MQLLEEQKAVQQKDRYDASISQIVWTPRKTVHLCTRKRTANTFLPVPMATSASSCTLTLSVNLAFNVPAKTVLTSIPKATELVARWMAWMLKMPPSCKLWWWWWEVVCLDQKLQELPTTEALVAVNLPKPQLLVTKQQCRTTPTIQPHNEKWCTTLHKFKEKMIKSKITPKKHIFS